MFGAGRVVVGLAVLMLLESAAAHAQEERRWSDEVWTPIFEHQGVAFSYLFYSEADNTNNGVVIRLVNENDHAVWYRFEVVFRTWEGEEHIEHVEGMIRAHEMKTGANDGLFWIPFTDGRSIGEVGLRGYEIEALGEGGSAPG